MTRNFREMLEKKWDAGKHVCVGLDPDYDAIVKDIDTRYPRPPGGERAPRGVRHLLSRFCHGIIDATKDHVLAYKPNVAFFEAHGSNGWIVLELVVEYIHKTAPDVPIILDAKRADIDNTNNGYVKMAFEHLKVDAITVSPYLGIGALKPFLDQKDKGIIILCRTSNKEAAEFQDMEAEKENRRWKLYQFVAQNAATNWNQNKNCCLVVGATVPEQLAEVRRIVGDMPLLLPGIGAQGGDIEKTVKAGHYKGRGMIINLSRSVLFASKGPDYAEAGCKEVQRVNGLINQYLKEAG